MVQYIDKSALVEEIQKTRESYRKCPAHTNYENGLKDGRLIGYEDVIHKINTLEVKEVDLEKEIANQYESNYEDYLTYEEFADIAKHFFELGLKAQKGD